MNEVEWRHSVAAMDTAFREAGRLRRLAEAREQRARNKMMATPEWQAAHAARCAQSKVDSTRKRVARLRADITQHSEYLRGLMNALRNARLEGRRTAPLLLARFPSGWQRRRYLQREWQTANADLARLEAAPEPHAEVVAVVDESKHANR